MHYLSFDLDLGHRNVAQYPLHHVTYLGTKFKVVMSNSLGGETLKRKVTDRRTEGQTDRRWTDFGTKLIYPFFIINILHFVMKFCPFVLKILSGNEILT